MIRIECVCGHSKACHTHLHKMKKGIIKYNYNVGKCRLKDCDCKKFKKKR